MQDIFWMEEVQSKQPFTICVLRSVGLSAGHLPLVLLYGGMKLRVCPNAAVATNVAHTLLVVIYFYSANVQNVFVFDQNSALSLPTKGIA